MLLDKVYNRIPSSKHLPWRGGSDTVSEGGAWLALCWDSQSIWDWSDPVAVRGSWAGKAVISRDGEADDSRVAAVTGYSDTVSVKMITMAVDSDIQSGKRNSSPHILRTENLYIGLDSGRTMDIRGQSVWLTMIPILVLRQFFPQSLPPRWEGTALAAFCVSYTIVHRGNRKRTIIQPDFIPIVLGMLAGHQAPLFTELASTPDWAVCEPDSRQQLWFPGRYVDLQGPSGFGTPLIGAGIL